MASPATPPGPAARRRSGWLYGLVGCLAVFFIALVGGAVFTVFVWHPWQPARDKSHGETTTEERTSVLEGATSATEITGSTDTKAQTSSLSVEAGNTPANGASYKLFAESGEVVASGTIPAQVDVPPNARYKLVAGRTGYRSWEGWQTIGAAGSSQSVTVKLEELPPEMVTVTVCTATGLRANQWCPITVRRDFRRSQEPGICTLHKPPPAQVGVRVCTVSGKRANRYCPTVVTRGFDPNRVPGYCTIHKAPPPPPPQQDTVVKTVCLDSGRLATKHCQRTGQRTFAVGDVPGYCTVCRPPPPGKPKATVRICNESGMRAGRYCVSTHTERLDADAIPPNCTLHTAPPNTQNPDTGEYKWCPECNARNRANARVCRKCGHRF